MACEVVQCERLLDEDLGGHAASKQRGSVAELETGHLKFVESGEGDVESGRIWDGDLKEILDWSAKKHGWDDVAHEHRDERVMQKAG